MEPVETEESVATTASRNTSPSLPEDAHLFAGETVTNTPAAASIDVCAKPDKSVTTDTSCTGDNLINNSHEGSSKDSVDSKMAMDTAGALTVDKDTQAEVSANKESENRNCSVSTAPLYGGAEGKMDVDNPSDIGSETVASSEPAKEKVEGDNKVEGGDSKVEGGDSKVGEGDSVMEGGDSSGPIEGEAGGVGVLTDAMISEEQRLKERASRESSSEGRDVQELKNMVEHQRYMRLQHLLERSTAYSKFLVNRMDGQEKKQQETKKESADGQRESEGSEQKNDKEMECISSQDEGGRVTRSGASLKSPVAPLPSDGQASAKKKRAGRKRKAEKSSGGSFKISDFMDSQGKLKKKKLDSGEASTGSSEQEKQEAVGAVAEERFYNGKPISPRQPKLLTGGIMRTYQLDGMEWVNTLYENGVNGILADEMGLGKTIQCISVIAHMIEKGVKGPFLVAAPLSTVPNWVAEFNKFTPTIPVVLYHGSAAERLQLRRQMFGKSSNLKRKTTKPVKQKQNAEELQPVVVTSYEICMRDQDYLQHRSWKFLVVDEGHRIKNLNCKLIKALKCYDAGNRLLLTGTPLQNNLSELWSLLNFLLPDIFDDLNSFQSWFDFNSGGEDEVRERIIEQEREQQVLKTLHQILTPFLLRRLKTDVECSLPPKKEILIYAPLTGHQERYYKSLLDNTIFNMMEEERKKKRKIEEEERKKKEGKENINGGGGEAMEFEDEEKRKRRGIRDGYAQLSDEQFDSIMRGEAEMEDFVKTSQTQVAKKKVPTSVTDIKMTSVFTMLRKCCNHPYLLEFPLTPDGQFKVDEDLVNCCGKTLVLDRLLPALIEEGHKTLIFSQFTSLLDILEDYLELRKLSYGRLDGSMAFAERQRQMTMFRESPDCMVFLLSTRAGGLGINLTSADTVIIYDSDWNPQCDLQAQDRCHRIGQTNPVMVYRLVTGNTIDQRIVERAASKRRLEKMVIHKGKFKGSIAESEMSLEDLVELLQSVDHDKVHKSKDDEVISDETLKALLDRSGSGRLEEGAQDKSKHSEVFKVIEERDGSGNVRKGMQSKEVGPTMDSLHITTTEAQ